jgi:hypothetical protein
MKLIRLTVTGVITFLVVTTILSAVLFMKCRCMGKHFSPCLCLVRGWTPAPRDDMPSCRDNLIALETAKYDWASEHGAGPGDEVTWDDLRPYLEQGRPPVCTSGGRYVLNPIGEEPDCVGPCRLHADPLAHALEPAALYAFDDAGNPLASTRATMRDLLEARRRFLRTPTTADGLATPSRSAERTEPR